MSPGFARETYQYTADSSSPTTDTTRPPPPPPRRDGETWTKSACADRVVLSGGDVRCTVLTEDFSDITGLPAELGIGDDLARTEQRVTIRVDSRRYGKPMTVVSGFDRSSVDLDDLASTLKRRLAVGGTVRDGRIELQGSHDERLRAALADEGIAVEA